MNEKSVGFNKNLTSYGDPKFSSFIRRAFLASAGYDKSDLDRPVVAIIDTNSDYTTCHRDMPGLIAAIKRGILQEGALPLSLPTMSLGEILISPTSMLFRNLLAMVTEEMLTSYPMDAAVLVGGCDKTVPAQLMAAISANIPSLSIVVGPMRTGWWNGKRLGACTDCRNFWQEYRSGNLTETDINAIQNKLCPTGGTCMVMGTASTMACLSETLGLMLPGGATSASGSGERLRHAVLTGRRAAFLAKNPLRPKDILKEGSFKNAMTVLMALGGSTNAIIHLLALARRADIPLNLRDFDQISQQTPLLVNCKPSGQFWLEDLHNAGGIPTLLSRLSSRLDLNVQLATGNTLESHLSEMKESNIDHIREQKPIIGSLENPIGPAGSLAVLYGSLAPEGAVLKVSAASPGLLCHRGPAIVFESPSDVANRIDDPKLEVTPNHVLILRNSGPSTGMPEAGSIPIPRKLAEKGVKDMLRVSDARMSGTAGGTVVLHCSPEAARGGPLSLVKDGDLIELDINKRMINILLSDSEKSIRREAYSRKTIMFAERGWKSIHEKHILPAHLGADLDFL